MRSCPSPFLSRTMDPEESTSPVDDDNYPPRPMPTNLPTSLNDRRHAPVEYIVPETEIYDGWQGESTPRGPVQPPTAGPLPRP